jgi:hypothetical protein
MSMVEFRRWIQKLLYRSGFSGKASEIEENHTSAETVQEPRIESIKGLGKLEQHPQISDWWRSRPVKVNVLDGKLLPFILEDEYNQVSLLQPIESAVANFLNLDPEHREELTERVYKNYEEMCKIATVPALPIREKSGIWKYVYPGDIFIQQGLDDPEIHILVTGNCEWEPEHGLQMVFRKGNEIVGVSEVTGYW